MIIIMIMVLKMKIKMKMSLYMVMRMITVLKMEMSAVFAPLPPLAPLHPEKKFSEMCHIVSGGGIASALKR